MYEGLLSFNETFVLQLNYCQLFCARDSLVLMYILNSLFLCFLALHRFYFVSIPLFCHMQRCSLICAILFHLCLPFFLLLFFVHWIQYIALTILINWILIRDIYFLFLILVISFHYEVHNFFIKKVGTDSLTLPVGILCKSAIFSWYSDSISFLIWS